MARGEITPRRYQVKTEGRRGLPAETERALDAMTNCRFGGRLPRGYKIPEFILDPDTGEIVPKPA